jgi:hypothetical protein
MRALVGAGTFSTRAKWRSSLSACHSVLENRLTPPTLSEKGFCNRYTALGRGHDETQHYARAHAASDPVCPHLDCSSTDTLGYDSHDNLKIKVEHVSFATEDAGAHLRRRSSGTINLAHHIPVKSKFQCVAVFDSASECEKGLSPIANVPRNLLTSAPPTVGASGSWDA